MKFKNKTTGEIRECSPKLLNASRVSAQNRKRLFWVGKLKTYYSNKLDNDEQWSEDVYEQVAITQPEDRGILLKDILEYGVSTEKSYCLPATYFKENTKSLEKRKKNGLIVLTKNGEEKMKSNTVRASGKGSGINDKHNWDTIRIGQIGKGGQGDRIYSPEGKSVNLSANGGGRGKNDKKYIPQDSGKANCITTGLGVEGLLAENTIIRKLTPIECERLQSLPDRYTEGISNSQRYKCLGNGMNCEVIRHILSFINK